MLSGLLSVCYLPGSPGHSRQSFPPCTGVNLPHVQNIPWISVDPFPQIVQAPLNCSTPWGDNHSSSSVSSGNLLWAHPAPPSLPLTGLLKCIDPWQTILWTGFQLDSMTLTTLITTFVPCIFTCFSVYLMPTYAAHTSSLCPEGFYERHC